MKKGLFLKPVKFNSFNRVKAVSIIFVFLMILSLSSAHIFAAETDRDFTLDDGTGDSPQVILRDETGDGELTVQKQDAGEADIINTEGPINLKPSGDVDDYIYFFTGSDLIGFFWKGYAATNDPGIRINATGQLEYRDQDSGTWVTFDSITGVSAFGDLSDVDLTGIAQGDIIYYNGTGWVRLATGTGGQVLTSDGAGNLSWADGLTNSLTIANILVGNASDVATGVTMSGDVAIDNTGATTIQADAVALATDTTGNFVATIADAGGSAITVANSGTEDAAITLDITDGGVVENDLVATLAFDDGDYLDLSAILHDDTVVQGLRLPQIGTSPSSPATGEGYLGWDETNNTLEYYNGTAWTAVGAGGDLWTDGTNGHYDNTEGIIVGSDIAETIDNTGFALNAGDLFVTDELGVEGAIYTDSGVTVGASTTYADGSITPTTGTALSVILGGADGDDLIVDTDTLVIESDNDRVGIGTTAPASLLDLSEATQTEIIRFTMVYYIR